MTSPNLEFHLRDALAIELPAELLQRLDVAVATRATGRGTRSRTWKVGLALALLLIAAPLVYVASAGRTSTETPFGSVDAPGYQAEIDIAKKAVPLPAGASWPWYVDVPDPQASYSRGGGRSQVEGVAFCLWLGSWLDATDTGDRAKRDVARATLLAVRDWELYKGAFADQSYRDVLEGIIVGVESNESEPGRAFFGPNCTSPAKPTTP